MSNQDYSSSDHGHHDHHSGHDAHQHHYHPHQPTATPRKPRAIEVLENPTSSVELSNVQGDVFPTFPKKAELFIFFTIRSPERFKSKLKQFITHITTAAEVIDKLGEIKKSKANNKNPGERKLIPMEQIQIAFSRVGFPHIGIDGGVGEDLFDRSQLEDALNLGDLPARVHDPANPTMPDWEEVWKTKVDGVFTIATESPDRCRNVAENKIKSLFKDTIRIINVVEGEVRAKEEGHEHFGYLDGISEPAIRGLADPHKGQLQCDAGVILMGHENDSKLTTRPEWTKEGTIMVFRKLQQFVPEFNKFVNDHPINLPGLDPAAGSALRGARMVGRWKSGAPIDLTPLVDDQSLTEDIDKINNFDFSVREPGEQFMGQVRCPFSAHIRKTAPRKGSTLNDRATERSLIIRAGIPYGKDVTREEKEAGATSIDRGLLFVCYNSALNPGFRFMQTTWANNARFPNPQVTEQRTVDPGLDPIIGNNVVEGGERAGTDGFSRLRMASGTNPENPNEELRMESDFVVARGGEYFFVPSISTLQRLARGEILVGSKPPAPADGGQPGGSAPGGNSGATIGAGAAAGGGDTGGGDGGAAE